jgi:ribosome-associated translation inhibitor RaiA
MSGEGVSAPWRTTPQPTHPTPGESSPRASSGDVRLVHHLPPSEPLPRADEAGGFAFIAEHANHFGSTDERSAESRFGTIQPGRTVFAAFQPPSSTDADPTSKPESRSSMQIQINTDHNIEGREALGAHIRGVVENALKHLASHVTRVEVHVADENGAKTAGDEKRCVMEARLEGRPPAAVTHQAATVHDAINGTADKLAHLIERTLGRLQEERRHRTDPVRTEPTP